LLCRVLIVNVCFLNVITGLLEQIDDDDDDEEEDDDKISIRNVTVHCRQCNVHTYVCSM